MASIPKTFYRVTNHNPPRHQLYYPGFNPVNSCWLDGSWVTVSEADWVARKVAHQALFNNLGKKVAKQHYRDPGTSLDRMTEAQRTAWKHYSGDAYIEVQYENGYIGKMSVATAGGQIDAGGIAFMRQEKARLIPKVKQPDGSITDQQTMYSDLPDDLIAPTDDPVDVWKNIVAQNVQREFDMFKGAIEVAEKEAAVNPSMAAFSLGMAFTRLVMQEESVIRQEYDKERWGIDDPYQTPDEVKARYVEMRKMLVDACSAETFEGFYEQARKNHNSCARANLDNTDGVLFNYVVPVFHADGTHEPWGPRDVPWNATR